MSLLKKKKIKSKVVIKKLSKPLEYEKFIKIKCPYCSKGSDRKKHIYIDVPVEKLPDTLSCFVCDNALPIKDILKTGIEIRRK